MKSFPIKTLRHKIIAIMLVVTGLLAIVNINIQAYVEYQQELVDIENNATRHVRSLSHPISEALWDLDLRQLEQLIVSISEDKYIRDIRLDGIDGTQISSSDDSFQSNDHHSYELRYNGRFLGILSYHIDDALIQQEVLSRLWLGLALNTLEALVIILVVIIIIYVLVTKPLKELYTLSKTINPKTTRKLELPESLTQSDDELSYVAKALQQLNSTSRRAIAAQRRTERQLLHHQNQLEQSIQLQTKAYKTQSQLHRILADMSLNILTCNEESMATVMYRAFEPIGSLLNIDRLSVLAVEDNVAKYRYSWRSDGSDNPYGQGFNIDSMTFLQRRLRSLEPILINDTDTLQRDAETEYQMLSELSIQSVAIFPLIDGKSIFGLLVASNTRGPSPWSDTQKTILSRLSTTVSELHIRMRNQKEMTALQDELIEANQRLHIAAETDELTGLPNRRQFMNELEHHANSLYVSTITTMMIDVDHFKQYNDLYGHVQGDFALRYVANALKHILAPCGHMVARIGGEEFCAQLINVSHQEALVLAERMRLEVSDLKIPHTGNEPFGVLSVSIGVSHQVVDEQIATQLLLENADAALYRAKEKGRNQVQSEPSENKQ
ncbi:diguanylate cyclase [Vibrio sp. SCSIO 43140]|uniref:GGDEF domain-containing protein n=1 Tax=Vibrio sp. SCSIO 43140 TaxID=2819100 RepID=UPI002075051F|nr:diguanylate cyclase [Vibrio sp. SCSIO 43140]USD61405.1 diguanylate cyclase [Vibrio sp. SCSIO 43140]